ncbi:LEG4 protein, partial [Pitta sordida]|nr:LEG4 protein [Pitta sordida]
PPHVPPRPRFEINLRAGACGDIALHLNPRMSQGTVVRNTFSSGGWGHEETDLPYNPFQRGDYFEVSIRCGNYRFKVFVDGKPLF